MAWLTGLWMMFHVLYINITYWACVEKFRGAVTLRCHSSSGWTAVIDSHISPSHPTHKSKSPIWLDNGGLFGDKKIINQNAELWFRWSVTVIARSSTGSFVVNFGDGADSKTIRFNLGMIYEIFCFKICFCLTDFKAETWIG